MQLKQFELTSLIAQRIQDTRFIPVNLYNKNGQVIIPKKRNATLVEIKKLKRFALSGLYYNAAEQLAIPADYTIEPPPGFSNKKLISVEKTQLLSAKIQTFLHKLAENLVTVQDSGELVKTVRDYFHWFEHQKDVLKGLININEFCTTQNNRYSVTVAVKRAVIVMALKSRIILRKTLRNREEAEQATIELMYAPWQNPDAHPQKRAAKACSPVSSFNL